MKAVKPLGSVTSLFRQNNVFKIIEAALEEAGLGLHDIVRTRVILRDIDNWKQAIEARELYCLDARPVDTIMAIDQFVNPEWLVEIEVDAVVTD